MTKQIDFYILKETDPNSRLPFACRILEKANAQRQKVFVHAQSQDDAHKLDDLLWTFREDSFIPHNLQGEGPNAPPPIQIGYSDHAKGFNEILINLHTDVPAFHTQFRRIIEIVCDDETWKKTSREHYRYYQEQGYNLKSHKL